MTTSSAAGVFDRAHRRTTVGLLMLVTFVAFEAMAVGTAMPTAVAELDGLAWYGWPFSAFLVASVVGMVLGGDARRPARPARRAAVRASPSSRPGCSLAGLAGHMALFVAGRAVQGLGGGVIGRPALRDRGPGLRAGLRPRLFGAFSTAWVLPALIGPLVAGLVTDARSAGGWSSSACCR